MTKPLKQILIIGRTQMAVNFLCNWFFAGGSVNHHSPETGVWEITPREVGLAVCSSLTARFIRIRKRHHCAA
jgi:hypothetical protein